MSISEFTPPTLPDPPLLGDEPLDYFTRVYLIFLQGLFKQMPEGSWKWSEDEKLTEIVITDQAPYPRDRLEQRPAIVTMRGPAQFANLSLDNMRNIDWVTGSKERTDLVACTMSIVCLAKLDTEAQKIGWLVMRHLRTFKVMLQKYGRFFKIGDEVSIGPASPPTGAVVTGEADSEVMMLTVQSPFFFQWTEREEPKDAVMAREIDTFMSTQLAPPDTTGVRQQTVYRRPTVRGMPIGGTSITPGHVSDPITIKVE
jgi:hypothetical protein